MGCCQAGKESRRVVKDASGHGNTRISGAELKMEFAGTALRTLLLAKPPIPLSLSLSLCTGRRQPPKAPPLSSGAAAALPAPRRVAPRSPTFHYLLLLMITSTSPPTRLRRPPPLSSCSRERFKGVRRRSWGRWVSEIRIRNSREKIWLGSYGTAEQAARAYDIASLLLRGTSCSTYLNFADSTDLMRTDNQVAALVARGIASPRTLQATASAAANSTVAKDEAVCSNGDGSSPENMDDDNCQQSSGTSAKDCESAAQSLHTDQYCMVKSKPGAHTSMYNANMPDSWWIQDVLTLILSPKERSCSPPFLSSCSTQLSPSVVRSGAPSPSSTTPTPIHNAYHGLPSSSKAPTTPDCLLKALFDDFQYPLEGLVRDGFMAIAPAVTTSKRFDTETVGTSCDVDSMQLWSYVC